MKRSLCILVTAGVLLAACSGDDRADAPTTTSEKPLSLQRKIKLENPADEPRPELDPNVMYPESFSAKQVEVVEAYRGYEHAALAAYDPPNPEHPLLARYADPERLAQLKANIGDLVRTNRAIRLPKESRTATFAMKVSVRGSKATVETCEVDDSYFADIDSGQQVGGGQALTYRFLTVLRHANGRWKVTGAASSQFDKWKGISGCAVQYGL